MNRICSTQSNLHKIFHQKLVVIGTKGWTQTALRGDTKVSKAILQRILIYIVHPCSLNLQFTKQIFQFKRENQKLVAPVKIFLSPHWSPVKVPTILKFPVQFSLPTTQVQVLGPRSLLSLNPKFCSNQMPSVWVSKLKFWSNLSNLANCLKLKCHCVHFQRECALNFCRI